MLCNSRVVSLVHPSGSKVFQKFIYAILVMFDVLRVSFACKLIQSNLFLAITLKGISITWHTFNSNFQPAVLKKNVILNFRHSNNPDKKITCAKSKKG